MTSRTELQSYAIEYHDAVRDYEISLFVTYIGNIVKSLARNGHMSVAYPILSKGNLIRRNPQGLLNKSDLGPMQGDYVSGVMKGLRVLFPDTDIFVTADDSQLLLNWSSAKSSPSN
jgi:hypothetical protein